MYFAPDPIPPDSPDRERYDNAIRQATAHCEAAGHEPPWPCADCIRRADRQFGNIA